MTTFTRIPLLLKENKEQILESCSSTFKTENRRAYDLIPEETINSDSQAFLDELIVSIETGNHTNIKTPEFEKTLQKIQSMCSSMAENGFFFTEAVSFIKTLKKGILDILHENSQKLGKQASQIRLISNLMDELIVFFDFYFVTHFDKHPRTEDPEILGYEKKLESLQLHAHKLNRAKTIQEVADNTYDAMVNTLRLSQVGLISIDKNHVHIYWPGGISYPGFLNLIPLEDYIESASIISRTVRTKKTQLINDVREDPDFNPGMGPWADLGNLSELAVPVVLDENVIAVLNAESTRLNAYTEQDRQLLETLASHVASAINRIGLLEEKERYEEKLEALHQHAKQLSDATTIEDVATYTIDVMATTLGFDRGSFCIVEEGFLKFIKIHGYEPSELGISKLDLNGPGITVRALRTRETQLISDTRKDKDFVEVLDPVRISERSLSELDVPVMIGDKVVAILNAESDSVDAFNDQDKTLLETLALHVGSAISRLNRADEVRQLAYRLNSLEPGGCYMSDSHERCFKAYAILSMQGVPGLCIVREDPQMVIENYGISVDEIVLLSSRPFKEFKALKDLQSVSIAISSFLKSGRGVVLFDGLEYLITRFGFDTVYRFIQEKRFDFLESEAVLLVPLDMETLDSREKALLSSEFKLLE